MVAKQRTPIHHCYGAHWIWHELTHKSLFLQFSIPITITESTGCYANHEHHHSSNWPSRCYADHQTCGMYTWYDTPIPYEMYHNSCANTSQHSTLGLETETIFSQPILLCAFSTNYHWRSRICPCPSPLHPGHSLFASPHIALRLTAAWERMNLHKKVYSKNCLVQLITGVWDVNQCRTKDSSLEN